MSKVSALYHTVFCTKHRRFTIPEAYLEDVYRYIWSETRNLNCKLLRIGGIPNHLHLLIDLHPSVCLSDFVKTVKAKSSYWMRRDDRFTAFDGWAREYFAATLSVDCKSAVVGYISSQKEHHCKVSFDDELVKLHIDSGVAYDDRDMRD
ncbi:MAG: IS200/IS605 family transposase [Paramuribaculum sp.]|nr:IS200/IS605 family transposase [Paramuribaculum sp.]